MSGLHLLYNALRVISVDFGMKRLFCSAVILSKVARASKTNVVMNSLDDL